MKMNEIDLPRKTISQLIAIFSGYPEIEKVVIFGSRALGNAKPGSDVDLAFSGNDLTLTIVGRIQNQLEEETLLPYFFDCLQAETIQNKELREHIQTYGKILYEKNTCHYPST